MEKIKKCSLHKQNTDGMVSSLNLSRAMGIKCIDSQVFSFVISVQIIMQYIHDIDNNNNTHV